MLLGLKDAINRDGMHSRSCPSIAPQCSTRIIQDAKAHRLQNEDSIM